MTLRIKDMRTLGQLIPGADKEAHKMGETKPGAEHFILSTLKLTDGTAANVFKRLGISGEQFKEAIKQQYSDALQAVGINPKILDDAIKPVESQSILQHSKASGRAVMQKLYALKRKDKDKPLLGAHIIAVVASMEHGVATRAFSVMGINNPELLAAARQELDLF